ncbi:MAG: hypothetical protein ACK5XN_24910 [Bacteroidota bacterium]
MENKKETIDKHDQLNQKEQIKIDLVEFKRKQEFKNFFKFHENSLIREGMTIQELISLLNYIKKHVVNSFLAEFNKGNLSIKAEQVDRVRQEYGQESKTVQEALQLIDDSINNIFFQDSIYKNLFIPKANLNESQRNLLERITKTKKGLKNPNSETDYSKISQTNEKNYNEVSEYLLPLFLSSLYGYDYDIKKSTIKDDPYSISKKLTLLNKYNGVTKEIKGILKSLSEYGVVEDEKKLLKKLNLFWRLCVPFLMDRKLQHEHLYDIIGNSEFAQLAAYFTHGKFFEDKDFFRERVLDTTNIKSLLPSNLRPPVVAV